MAEINLFKHNYASKNVYDKFCEKNTKTKVRKNKEIHKKLIKQ